jgi:hypothetical protein
MRPIPLFGIALIATALHSAPAGASVEVKFAGSNYTDINIRDRPAYGSIRTILRQLGARYLGRGDRLSITVLDVDLAGFDLSTMGASRSGSSTAQHRPRSGCATGWCGAARSSLPARICCLTRCT